jgi:hypothetical protein
MKQASDTNSKPQRSHRDIKTMDFTGLFSLAEDELDSPEFLAAISLTVLIAGAEEHHLEHVRNRNPSRLYLCRPQLSHNPREESAWVRLYKSQNDRAFITTMGVDVETFHYILGNGFGHAWTYTPIPREDSQLGNPRLGRRSLDAAGALGLILHFYSSSMLEVSLQQIFSLIPTTVTRYLNFSKPLLLDTLKHIPEGHIRFTQPDQFASDNALIRQRHPLLEGAFASIDGLALPLQVSNDPEIENATFNAWKQTHYVTNILAFSPRGT